MSGAAKTPLGLLLGAMIGVDMGGPINKVAATFAQTQVDTLPYLMGGVGAAIAVPPIGIGLATLLFKRNSQKMIVDQEQLLSLWDAWESQKERSHLQQLMSA